MHCLQRFKNRTLALCSQDPGCRSFQLHVARRVDLRYLLQRRSRKRRLPRRKRPEHRKRRRPLFRRRWPRRTRRLSSSRSALAFAVAIPVSRYREKIGLVFTVSIHSSLYHKMYFARYTVSRNVFNVIQCFIIYIPSLGAEADLRGAEATEEIGGGGHEPS